MSQNAVACITRHLTSAILLRARANQKRANSASSQKGEQYEYVIRETRKKVMKRSADVSWTIAMLHCSITRRSVTKGGDHRLRRQDLSFGYSEPYHKFADVK